MIEVSKNDFFKAIGPKNVHPSIQPGRYPYTSLWEMQDGSRQVIGKTVGGLESTAFYLVSAGEA